MMLMISSTARMQASKYFIKSVMLNRHLFPSPSPSRHTLTCAADAALLPMPLLAGIVAGRYVPFTMQAPHANPNTVSYILTASAAMDS